MAAKDKVPSILKIFNFSECKMTEASLDPGQTTSKRAVYQTFVASSQHSGLDPA
jgi:hypothetical protein